MTRPVERPECGRMSLSHTAARDQGRNKSALVIWVKSFVLAGGSALLPSMVDLFPDYWYFSLLVLAVVKALEITGTAGKPAVEDRRILDLFFTPILFSEKLYLRPQGRGPPLLAKAVRIRAEL